MTNIIAPAIKIYYYNPHNFEQIQISLKVRTIDYEAYIFKK